MRLFLLIVAFVFTFGADAANSPIIYGPDGSGGTCAYDLISRECVSTSSDSLSTPVSIANGGTAKALTLSAGGIPYFDANSFEVLAAGASGKVLTSGGAGAPTWETNTSSQWTADSDGIKHTPAAGDSVRIGEGSFINSATPLVVMTPDASSYVTFLGSSNATTHGALGVISLADIAGTAFDFSADFQGLNSNNTAVKPINFNRQGGPVNLGLSGAGNEIKIWSVADGNLSTSSNVLTSSSDARLKDVQGPYERGIEDLKKVSPVLYKWKAGRPEGAYGFTYAGFTAQDLEKGIPEAVTEGQDGYLSVYDRPVIAALVNAVKELSARLEKIEGPAYKAKATLPLSKRKVMPQTDKGPCTLAHCLKKAK